jgi:hypothetical protein
MLGLRILKKKTFFHEDIVTIVTIVTIEYIVTIVTIVIRYRNG